MAFSSLPTEIRLKIWQCLIEPRTVHLWTEGKLISARGRVGRTQMLKRRYIVTSSPVPVLLQINQESRTFGTTGQYQKFILMGEHEQPYVWGSFDLDIVQIDTNYFDEFQFCAHHIRRLQFEAENTNECFYHWDSQNLPIFSNLIQCFVKAIDGWEAFDDTREVQGYSCVPEEHYIIDLERERIMTYPEVVAFTDLEWEVRKHLTAGRPVPTNLAVDLMYPKHRWYPASERKFVVTTPPYSDIT